MGLYFKLKEAYEKLQLDNETKFKNDKLEHYNLNRQDFSHQLNENDFMEHSDITQIIHFADVHEKSWKIKGGIVMGMWDEIGKMFSMAIRDTTGEILIKAFEKNAERLSEISVIGN